VTLEAKRVLYNSTEGVLLNRTADDRWLVLPRRALIHAGDEVASPEPFESVLQLLDAEAEIVLNGARIVWRPTPPDADAALEINRGRVVLRKSPLASPEKTLRVQLGLGGSTYLLELLEPGTICGLDVQWQPSAGGPDVPQSPSFDGGVYLAAGAPCVLAVHDSGRFWRRPGWMKLPGVVTVRFLPPIEPGLDRKTFIRTLETRLDEGLAALAETAAPAAGAPEPEGNAAA
jgi:hypothetical protein